MTPGSDHATTGQAPAPDGKVSIGRAASISKDSTITIGVLLVIVVAAVANFGIILRFNSSLTRNETMNEQLASRVEELSDRIEALQTEVRASDKERSRAIADLRVAVSGISDIKAGLSRVEARLASQERRNGGKDE